MARYRNREQFPEHFDARLAWLAGVFAVLLGLLLVRLWVVQIRQGERLAERLGHQTIRKIRMNPVRGRMFGNDGETLLADTPPSYDLVFRLAEMRQPGRRSETVRHIASTANEFARLLERPNPFSMETPERHLRVYPTLPLTVFSDLTRSEMAAVVERLPLLPAAEIRPSSRRTYPFPGVATHVLGFAGRRHPSDEPRRYSFVVPELHGRAGLEKQYNEELSGTPGMRVVRVDMLGFVYEELGSTEPAVPGNDLVLSLDPRLQAIACELLEGKEGAIVVVETDTGAVLAMESSPTYDLTQLTGNRYSELAEDTQNRPLVNRAANGAYMPGSILKPLIAMAALRTNVVTPRETVDCPGYSRVGNARIGCWYRPGHGEVTMIEAIEQSCNAYFIDVGMRVGLDHIRPLMLAAGFGRETGIDLPYSRAGMVPSREWARREWGRGWLAIDTAYLSIGQGAVAISPLQAALYAAAIANGGTVYRPYLVREVRTPDGELRHRTQPTANSSLPVGPRDLDIIRRGMHDVVNGPEATAERAQNDALRLAGKTGTAEVGPRDDRTHNTWFICFGPIENPKYAAAVLVRHGESGGRTAAPLAGKLFEQWLRPEAHGSPETQPPTPPP